MKRPPGPDPRQATLFDLGRTRPPGPAPSAPSPAAPRPAPDAGGRLGRRGVSGGDLRALDGGFTLDQIAAFEERLSRLLGGRLRSLVLTGNRTRILSARPAAGDPQGLQLRIHWWFVGAPREVLEAVASFVRGQTRGGARRRDLAALRSHFAERPGGEEEGPAPAPPRRRLVLRPVGRTLDLRQVCDELNRRFFEGRLKVRITWGRRLPGTACRTGGKGRRRSIRLGSFHADEGVIRIHRALDRPEVPRYVVESVVYHELLHADIPAVVQGGRRRVHTPELRRRERLFPEHEKAQRWLESNLGALLEARAPEASRRDA